MRAVNDEQELYDVAVLGCGKTIAGIGDLLANSLGRCPAYNFRAPCQ